MVKTEYLRDVRRYENRIRELLEAADEEFVPPLSTRTGTTGYVRPSDRRGSDVVDYYEQCLDQSFVLAHRGDQVLGFLSFREHYGGEELGEFAPSNYVSTIVVAPDHRRQGIARSMYATVLDNLPEAVRRPYVTTRTWSTNDEHVALLRELGFSPLARVEDDRGAGIDSVYYGISREEYDERR